MTNPSKRLWGGTAAFYVGLLLLLAGVAVGAYFLFFRPDSVPVTPRTAAPSTQAPAGERPGTELPTEELPAGEQPGTELPTEELPAGEQPLTTAAPAQLPAETGETTKEPARETAAVQIPSLPVEQKAVAVTPPTLIVSPLNGEVVAAFSVDQLAYSATMDDWRTHDGMDIAAPQGTKVLSASAGTVLRVYADDLLGTTVVVGHAGGCQTTYANLQSQPTVEEGETVSAGQVLGAVGTTALSETALGPHLHFSVSRNGDALDPADFLGK